MPSRSARAPRLAPEQRREQLLAAALSVVADRGFDAVTVDSVARRAGVTRPVVYDLFGDLEQMMLALIEHEERRALAPLLDVLGRVPRPGSDPAEFLAAAVATFLHAVRSSPATWRVILMPAHGTSEELRRRIRASRRMLADRIEPLLAWGIGQRGEPECFDVELGARLIVAAGEDAARLTLAHPRRFAPDRFAGFAAEGAALLPADLRPRGVPPPRPIEIPERETGEAPGHDARAARDSAQGQGRVPRAQRREQLLDVALELLGEEGFAGISMEAIARRAAVNRAVVYRSFPNLGVLLAALLRREDRRTRRVLAALLPERPRGQHPVRVLGEALSRFLEAVVSDPRTWRLALLRPESAPAALQKLVEHRRRELARRIQPLVEWGLAAAPGGPHTLDVEIFSRMLLAMAEEEGRLALEDPEFPVSRLLQSSWALLEALWPT